MQFLQSNLVACTLGTFIYLLVTFLLCRPLAHPPAAKAEEEHKLNAPTSSWTFSNPEVDELIKELKQEKEALAVKEKELKDLAARLQSERAELGQITQAVHQLRKEFDATVTRVKDDEVVNLKKLAKNYSTMTPEGAASIFKALDDASVVKIMMLMKETETAPILETMAKQSDAMAKRVASISERIRLAANSPKKAPGP